MNGCLILIDIEYLSLEFWKYIYQNRDDGRGLEELLSPSSV